MKSAETADCGKTITVSDWVRYWLEIYIRPVFKPASYEHYRNYAEVHILPTLGEEPIVSVTPGRIQRFFNQEAAHGNHKTGGPLSAKTMRNLRVVLDVAFKAALAEGVIDKNPVPLTVVRSVKTKRVEVMTNDMQQVLEEYLFSHYHHYHAGILFALFTGMRLGEICALRWSDYDESEKRLTVSRTVRRTKTYSDDPGEPKTRLVVTDPKSDASARELFMPPVLQELLADQKIRFAKDHHIPTDDDFIVFSENGGMVDPDNLSHYFSRLLKKLGIDHVKFHAMRHTFATRTIEGGVDVATVSGLLGHTDVTTTTHFYVHPRNQAMEEAMKHITPVTTKKFAFHPAEERHS